MNIQSKKPAHGAGRLRRGEWVALVFAFGWSVAVLAAAALAPAYQSENATSSGAASPGSASMLDQNGPWILLVIAIPLVVTLIVGYALWRRGGQRGAGPVAWTFTGLLVGFNLVAMFSIGLFILPITACLVVACVIRNARAHGEVEGAAAHS